MMSPTSRCGRRPFSWVSRNAECGSWPAAGPGRMTDSAAQRPLRLWGEVDLHFK